METLTNPTKENVIAAIEPLALAAKPKLYDRFATVVADMVRIAKNHDCSVTLEASSNLIDITAHTATVTLYSYDQRKFAARYLELQFDEDCVVDELRVRVNSYKKRRARINSYGKVEWESARITQAGFVRFGAYMDYHEAKWNGQRVNGTERWRLFHRSLRDIITRLEKQGGAGSELNMQTFVKMLKTDQLAHALQDDIDFIKQELNDRIKDIFTKNWGISIASMEAREPSWLIDVNNTLDKSEIGYFFRRDDLGFGSMLLSKLYENSRYSVRFMLTYLLTEKVYKINYDNEGSFCRFAGFQKSFRKLYANVDEVVDAVKAILQLEKTLCLKAQAMQASMNELLATTTIKPKEAN